MLNKSKTGSGVDRNKKIKQDLPQWVKFIKSARKTLTFSRTIAALSGGLVQLCKVEKVFGKDLRSDYEFCDTAKSRLFSLLNRSCYLLQCD